MIEDYYRYDIDKIYVIQLIILNPMKKTNITIYLDYVTKSTIIMYGHSIIY